MFLSREIDSSLDYYSSSVFQHHAWKNFFFYEDIYYHYGTILSCHPSFKCISHLIPIKNTKCYEDGTKIHYAIKTEPDCLIHVMMERRYQIQVFFEEMAFLSFLMHVTLFWGLNTRMSLLYTIIEAKIIVLSASHQKMYGEQPVTLKKIFILLKWSIWWQNV